MTALPPPGFEEIQAWLVAHLAARLELSPAEIDVHQELAAFGVDSQQGVQIAGHLEEWLRRPLDPMIVWSYPTIERLARHLAEGAPYPEEPGWDLE